MLAPNAAAGQLGRRDQPTRSKSPIVVHITCPGRYRHLGPATGETSGNVNQRGNACMLSLCSLPACHQPRQIHQRSAQTHQRSTAPEGWHGPCPPNPPAPPPPLHTTGDPLPWRDPARRRRVSRAVFQSDLRARRTARRNARPGCAVHVRCPPAHPRGPPVSVSLPVPPFRFRVVWSQRRGKGFLQTKNTLHDASTCTAHSGATKAHDWMVGALGPLFRTAGHTVRTQHGVTASACQRRGDVEIRN